MRIKRLAAAFALAPLGAVALVAVLFGRHSGAPTTWFDGGPNPLVGYVTIAGMAYATGAALLPLFFILEYFGKRGWQFYVPIASAAGFLVGRLLEPASANASLHLVFSIAGGLCGVVFSFVLGWRSNMQPSAPASPSRGG